MADYERAEMMIDDAGNLLAFKSGAPEPTVVIAAGGGLPSGWTESGSPADVQTNGGTLIVECDESVPDAIFATRDVTSMDVIAAYDNGDGTLDSVQIANGRLTVTPDGSTELVAATAATVDAATDIRLGSGSKGLAIGALDGAAYLAQRGFTAAPADGLFAAGQFAIWLDDTPGATKLMVKAKDSGGTVRTAAIALT